MLRDKSGFQKQNKILVLGLRLTSKEQCVYISSPKKTQLCSSTDMIKWHLAKKV